MSAATTAPARGKRKAKVGRVVSDKMDKTIVVSVERLARHRIYKRVIRLTTKFKAHDERNEAHVGDTVRIEESRPLSATKRWRLAEILVVAGEGAGETVVAEEPETAEAIHMAAHPGREAAVEARAEVDEVSAEAVEARAEVDEASAEADQASAEADQAPAEAVEVSAQADEVPAEDANTGTVSTDEAAAAEGEEAQA
jgi:small subunit ribosomal protein S17